MLSNIYLLFVLFLLNVSLIRSESFSREEILAEGYDRLEPPKIGDNPVDVNIRLVILNLRAVRETDLTYTIDAFYHQRWIDYRFKNRTKEPIILNKEWGKKIWIPDTFFKQAISGSISNIVFPSVYYMIHSNGEVFMGARLTVTLTCNMRFEKYPHDIQYCQVDIQSLSHRIDTVKLRWKEFLIVPLISAVQYNVSVGYLGDCSRNYSIGHLSCLRGEIVLARRLGHFFFKKYLPSCLIVIMSFVGFWIPTDSYPARIALVVTSLLGLITQEIQSSGEINASYVVALNIWYIICISFVFLALIEFGFAMFHFQKKNQLNCQSLYQKLNLQRQSLETASDLPFSITRPSHTTKSQPIRHDDQHWMRLIAQKLIATNLRDGNAVDILSRRLFPVSFAICIALYITFFQLF